MNSGGDYGRVRDGVMGLHEGAKEVLATSDYTCAAHARYADRVDTRISSRTLRVYVVLRLLPSSQDGLRTV